MRRYKKRPLRLVILISALLILVMLSEGSSAQVIAQAQSDPRLYGTWLMKQGWVEMQLELHPDGRMVLVGGAGTYRVVGPGQIETNIGWEGKKVYNYEIKGNVLRLFGGDMLGERIFSKISDSSTYSDTYRLGQLSADITGTWEGNYGGQQVVIAFNTDGSMTMGGNRWRYMASEGQLQVITATGTVYYNMTLEGGTLQLSGGDVQGVMTLRRQGGNQGFQVDFNAIKPLVGNWATVYNGQQLKLALGADGSMDFAGNKWQYTVQGNRLVVSKSEGPIAYNMILQGSSLTVSGGDIQGSMTFQRDSGDRQDQGFDIDSARPILGAWETGLGSGKMDMVFSEDGSMTLGGESWRYSVKGGQLHVDTGSGVAVYSFDLQADTLSLSGSDIQGTLMFTRKGGQQQQQQGSPFGKLQKQQTETADDQTGGGSLPLPDNLADLTVGQRFTPPAGAERKEGVAEGVPYVVYTYRWNNSTVSVMVDDDMNVEIIAWSAYITLQQAVDTKNEQLTKYGDHVVSREESGNTYKYTFDDGRYSWDMEWDGQMIQFSCMGSIKKLGEETEGQGEEIDKRPGEESTAGEKLRRGVGELNLGETYYPEDILDEGIESEDGTLSFIVLGEGMSKWVTTDADKKITEFKIEFDDIPAEKAKDLRRDHLQYYKQYLKDETEALGDFFLVFNDGQTEIELRYFSGELSTAYRDLARVKKEE